MVFLESDIPIFMIQSTNRFLLIFWVWILAAGYAKAQQLGVTPERSGYFSTAPIAQSPRLKWKVKTGNRIFASPVGYQDRLFVGSCDSLLYALAKTDGHTLWTFKAGGEIRSSVAVEEGKVYFSATDGRFYAVNAADGKLQWTFETGGERFHDTWDYHQSSPAVHQNTVYFGSGDGHLYALDRLTGKLQWKFATGGIVHASPVVADGALLVGSFDGFFYCIETDGRLRWKFKTVGERYFPKGEIQFHATVSGHTVYFCSRDFNVYALNIKDGTGQWVYHQLGSWTSVPALANGKLLVTMSDAHILLGLEAESGKNLLEAPVPLNVFSGASVQGDSAYVGSMDGQLYRVNLSTGKSSVIFQTEASRRHRPDFFEDNEKLRAGLEEKYKDDFTLLYADFLKMGSILSTVWIADGTLFFGSADGCIYALQ